LQEVLAAGFQALEHLLPLIFSDLDREGDLLGLIGFERGPEVLVDRDECVLEDALAEDSIEFIKTHFVKSAVLAYLTLNDLESLISMDLLD